MKFYIIKTPTREYFNQNSAKIRSVVTFSLPFISILLFYTTKEFLYDKKIQCYYRKYYI